ncbi:MAG: hypothetical protein IT427_18470 [Pirellulales bacterium]|nr:hypothetical protein [Pirellulales bacterium]
MAARENQGLQIALIVFVMLTIMLSVSTFLFFRNYQAEQQRAKSAEEETSKTKQAMTVLEGDRSAYVKYIGFPENEKKETIDEAIAKDFAVGVMLGLASLPENERNYRKLISSYEALAKNQHGQLADKDKQLREAKAAFDQKTTEYADNVAKITKDKDDEVAKYAEERKNREDQIALLVKTKDQLLAEKDTAAKALGDLKAQTDKELNTLKDAVTKKDDTIQGLKLNINEVTKQYNVTAAPDGRIVWVNQREGTAVINLGSADNLRKRITFSVFDPGTTDVSALKSDTSGKEEAATPASAAVVKGSIEVVNITGRHMAECRILQHSPSNPIIPGDVIYTPVWQPGQQDHFAFAGKLDIDGDGEDDSSRVKDIVRINGGAIDSDINVQTRYLVIGKLDDQGENSDSSKLLADAKKFGIQHIKLGQFLEMMGFSAKAAEGTIAPGEGMRYPNAGEPTAKFRPRNPPPAGKQGISAFQTQAGEEAKK